jgi:iron complex outermembrane receptor protein
MQDKDSLLKLGLSDNSKDTRYFISYIDGEYQFDTDNKIALRIYNAHYKNIYNYDSLDDISVYLSFFNRFGKFDFYNGFVYHKNSLDWKSYIDWTSTISMDINENLTITLKGDNILDRAKETNIFRFDPSKTPEMMMEPLHVSPIDRMFSINVEYRF